MLSSPVLKLITVTIVIVVNDKTTNETIQFVPKYVVKPNNSTSKSLEAGEKISLNITLYEQNNLNVTIFNETFILNGTSKIINISNLGEIKKAKKGETLNIDCEVGSEVDQGNYMLERTLNGKIEDITPFVSGYIPFIKKSNS